MDCQSDQRGYRISLAIVSALMSFADAVFAQPSAQTSEVIAVLEERVESLDHVFRRAEAIVQIGAIRGFRTGDRDIAGYHLAMAKAELAAARGRKREAADIYQQAVEHAQRNHRYTSAEVNNGTSSVEALGRAQNLVIDANLALIRHQSGEVTQNGGQARVGLLQQKVRNAKLTFKTAEATFESGGVRDFKAADYHHCAYRLAKAKSEALIAEGKPEQVAASLHETAVHAERFAQSAQRLYQFGRCTPTMLLDAQSAWYAAQLANIRHESNGEDRRAEEIRLLEARVRAFAASFKGIETKLGVGAPGARSVDREFAGYLHASATAELSLARGQTNDAISQLQQAVEFADRRLLHMKTLVKAGTGMMIAEIRAINELAGIKLKLNEIRNAAK